MNANIADNDSECVHTMSTYNNMSIAGAKGENKVWCWGRVSAAWVGVPQKSVKCEGVVHCCRWGDWCNSVTQRCLQPVYWVFISLAVQRYNTSTTDKHRDCHVRSPPASKRLSCMWLT